MVLSNDEIRQIITTHLMQSSESKGQFLEWREKRINEALGWKGGPSQELAVKCHVDFLQDDLEVFFLKPGKEVFRKKNPNVHDMTPFVGDVYTKAQFMRVWGILTKLSLKDFLRFKMVLALLYRNMCFLDHREIDGKVRYRPSEQVMQCINELDGTFEGLLPDGGLLALMYFHDILAWNEDVKYHTEEGRPTFKGKYKEDVGRKTFFQTTLQVVHETASFMQDVLQHDDDPLKIDVDKIYSIMQQFTRGRGVATASNKQIVLWLGDFIQKK